MIENTGQQLYSEVISEDSISKNQKWIPVN